MKSFKKRRHQLDDIDDDDVERFLFDDAPTNLDIAAIRADPEFNLFENWRMDVEPDLDEILSGIADTEAPVVPKVRVLLAPTFWVCWTSKSDLSSTKKCDQNHIIDNYEFGHT